MGLDIRAYRGLQLAPADQLSDDSSLYLREALAYTNKAFPGRADGLHPEMAYSGCEDSFAFQAGFDHGESGVQPQAIALGPELSM